MKTNKLNFAILSAILFNVEKVKNDDVICNKECAYDVYVYPVFDGIEQKIKVQSCSNIYALVPNTEIFPVIEQILDNWNIKYTATYEIVKNAEFVVKYVIDDSRYTYKIKGSHDEVKPQIVVTHSYNGQKKYKIVFGYFRLVCTNGMTIPVAEMKEFNLCITGKHTESVRRSLRQLNGIIQHFAENATNITDAIIAKYDILANSVPANVTERINSALKVAGINAIDNKKFNTLQYIINTAENDANNVELGFNGTVNDWLVYNAINSYLFDSTLNITAYEKQAEKDSKVFEYMLKTV